MDEKLQEILSSFDRMHKNHVQPMTPKEYDHCTFISSLIGKEHSYASTRETLSFDEVQSTAFDSFKIYKDFRLSHELHKVIRRADITQEEKIVVPSFSQFQTGILSERNPKTDYFSVRLITTPRFFDELSPYYFGHEFHHILKDINPKEYQYMLRYAEVIPQFYELIACERDPEKQKKLVQNRLALLNSMRGYLLLHNTRKDNNELWKYYDSKYCQYFNSFYYSVLLYQLYQNSPKKVLKEVKRVLRKEISTYQLLEEFHLFDREFHSEVESGIQYLKKYSMESL